MEWWQTRRFRMGLAAGAATLVAVVAAQALSRPLLTSYWVASELETLRRDPDAVEASQVRRWARMGDEGLLALVDLLREEEAPIRQAARTALRNEWNSWRLLDAEERDRRTLLTFGRCVSKGRTLGPEEAELLSEWVTETLSRRIDPTRSGRMALACQDALECAAAPKGSLSELDSTIASSDLLGPPSTRAGSATSDLPAELVQPASFGSGPHGAAGLRSAGRDLPQLR
ncbi:MAG TPA: hypothetical protein VGN57_10540 [Pirellulaceae bacterium]|nr:hypothetical protein [Pirellulaceae bacterium]